MKIITARPHRLLRHIITQIGELTKQQERCMLLVPSQFTLQAEIEIMEQLNLAGSFTIDVLSPGRLQGRVFERAGMPDRTVFDESGKCMVLTEIIAQEKEALTVYRTAAGNGALSLAQKMSATIAEFKRAGVSADALRAQLETLDEEARRVPTVRKLMDVAYVYAAYTERMQGQLYDAEDIAQEMQARLERSGVLQGQHVFIYGFDMITPAFADDLTVMAKLAKSLTLAVETDRNGAPDGRLFAPVNASIERLCTLAGERNVHVEREWLDTPLDAPKEIQMLERGLYALGGRGIQGAPQRIALHAVSGMRQEVHAVGAQIRNLLAEGEDASQIAVVYPKGSSYASVLSSVLPLYGVCSYVAVKREAGAHPLCRFIMASLAVVTGGWHPSDVIEVMQSGFIRVERKQADALCAYMEELDIRSEAIKRPFTYCGTYDEETLATLNACREQVVTPLIRLGERLSHAQQADDTIDAILDLLQEVQAFEVLEEMRAELMDQGMEPEAEDCVQIWNHLMEILDQMHTLLQGNRAQGKEVLELLKSGLSTLELAALPPADGAVICGEIGNLRTGRVCRLFAIGMNDQGNNADGRLLTEQEQEEASQITGTYMGMSAAERAALAQLDELKVLTSCTESVQVSYAMADETGRVLREGTAVQALKRLFPQMPVYGGLVAQEREAMLCAPDSALEAMGVALCAAVDGTQSLSDAYEKAYAAMFQSEQGREKLKMVTRQLGGEAPRMLRSRQARKLYGRPVMSVSRLEAFAQCPYKHFVRYGLVPKEKKEPGVDRAELGTLYHQAAETFTRELVALPQFPNVDAQTCDSLMEEAVKPLVEAWRQSPLGESARGAAFARRITRTAKQTARSIVRQYAGSAFEPMQFEMVFGQKNIAPIMLELSDGTYVYLQGRIDRVDVMEDEMGRHIRVIDYKSGSKKFDPTMVYYGLQLQLLLYLAAALVQVPDAQAAGFFYCRIADPTIKTESRMKEEVEKQIAKKLALAGISLSDVQILRAQGPQHAGMITKDGKPSGTYRSSMADAQQMQAMVTFAEAKAAQLASAAYEGEIKDAPAVFGTYQACAQCRYRAVCGFDQAIQPHRRLVKKSMEDLQLWKSDEDPTKP